MKFIRLNTAFVPPLEVNEKAIELSRAISDSADAYFILDGVQFYPHITIYPPEYPEGNIIKVLETIGKITGLINRIRFQYKKVGVVEGSIVITFERSPQIQEVHERVVGALNGLRNGRIRDKYNQMQFNSEQTQNVEKYGYPDVMNLYNSHLTITRLKSEDKAQEILSTIRWDIPEFIVDKIGVYRMGEHGICRELIKEFSLG